MEIVANYNQVEEFESNGFDWEAGPIYEILLCPACSQITFRKYLYHSFFEPDEWTLEILYPNVVVPIKGLPSKVKSAYEAANKVRIIDGNAYAVLLGRVLDVVCTDRGINGKTLDEKLQNLASTGEIPERLYKLASQLRKLRNIGAHADLGTLTPEVPILEDITRAILEYVYRAPALLDKVTEHLEKLKSSTSK